ncbi:amidohydrolase family protein [Phytohabitans sp. ZYX-F-186]|uniref:Amidohydrolase family protein n=1 Tax=Phytohabitans maris TaxID=3071409 RepID=A0ABU0ZDW6_9ACTN|nr:amidohydrolase family protein [Phytohabitans sp. ZYX-F-186]MDQ7905249.1 amidohydrolase family protein [Phytohabitans sp. ZYX-F-186]
MTTTDLPMIISVDDHIIEPPTLFERWLPAKYQDRAPRVERRLISKESKLFNGLVEDPDGDPGDVWLFGDSAYVLRRPILILDGVETTADMRGNEPATYDQMHPACYDPQARLDVMTSQHVEASLAFPTFPRFCGQALSEQTSKDRDFGLACVEAYNNFIVEEWCGNSGGRLIPLPVVPLWDPALAAAEVRRNAARGVRAVTFSEIVGHLGFPSIHHGNWDPFFAACEETGTVICMHIGSSSKMMPMPPDAPDVITTTLQFSNSYASMADFIFSGVLDRFPALKLAYSEGQAGWLPYAMERMDHAYTHHTWGHGEVKMQELPSTYVRRNMYGCIFADRHAIEQAPHIGVDNLMFEVDFPHADGPYPHTLEHLAEQFAGIDAETTYKIVRGNAIQLFQLDLDRQPA